MNPIFHTIIMILVALFVIGCEKAEKSQIDSCEEQPAWTGYDEICGCFGEPIAFSKKCITSFENGDIPYFGYVNYGHIKDSILLIIKNNKKVVDIKTISDFPSLDTKGADLDWYLTNNRPIQLLYDDSFWNNPAALGDGTELRLDPNVLLDEPETITLRFYQREFLRLNAQILDSTSVVVTKELNRR